MKLITEFYQSLDTLNLIIFWGIIVVIILLIIFSYLLITKNKKSKKTKENKTQQYEEELPIKNEIDNITLKEEEKNENVLTYENKEEKISSSKPIEAESLFVAEEHVINYNKEINDNIKEESVPTEKEAISNEPIKSQPFEMPTGPYQRNVLREMSLSQTSPIGINRVDSKKEKKIEMAKDLERSLNEKNIEPELEIIEEKEEITNQVKEEIQEEKNIINYDERKTEIIELHEKEVHLETPAKDLLDIPTIENYEKKEKSSSEIYLEEVSKKLAEAETPEDIERTNYELKQEEDAIISYTELMSKKDNIQTIDEEDAVISIEELMKRNNQNHQEKIQEEIKQKKY